MTPERLTQLVRRHNWIQRSIGVGGMFAAGGLWFASFWVFRWFVLLWTYILSVADLWTPQDKGWSLSFWLALTFTAVLAVEGLRRSIPVFDLAEFNDSSYFVEGTGPGAWWYGDPFATSWVVSRFLFLAPLTTVISVNAWRSIIHVAPDTIDQAAAILTKLGEDRQWVSPTTFGDCGRAAWLLNRLHLIWVERKQGEFQIRFPAGTTMAELEA